MQIKLEKAITPEVKTLTDVRIKQIVIEFPPNRKPTVRIARAFGYVENDTFVENSSMHDQLVISESEIDFSGIVSAAMKEKEIQDQEAEKAAAAQAEKEAEVINKKEALKKSESELREIEKQNPM